MKTRHPARKPAPTLPQQEAVFTAEGAPPPGQVGQNGPQDEAGPPGEATAASTRAATDESGEEAAEDAAEAAAGEAAGEAAAPPSTPTGRPAHIVGEVDSRQGDGTNFRIRKGPCMVQLTVLDAIVDWRDGDFSGRAAMPLADFNSHVESGAIVFDESAQD